MNKKCNGLMMVLMLFSTTLSLASEVAVDSQKDRYEAIVKAFEAKELKADNVNEDINIVEEHKKTLETKLAVEKKEVATSYVPILLKIAGGGFGLAALAGGVVSVFGSILASNLFAVPRNEGTVITIKDERSSWGPQYILSENKGEIHSYEEFPESHEVSKPMQGATWFQWWRAMAGARVTGSAISDPRAQIADLFYQYSLKPGWNSFSEGERTLIEGTPLFAVASLVSAGIARYLFNKAVSYRDEMVRLEKEIERDEVILDVLKKQAGGEMLRKRGLQF